MSQKLQRPSPAAGLNESPSEKEGKSAPSHTLLSLIQHASMKVPPKRKGNRSRRLVMGLCLSGLNESPSEKEGKSGRGVVGACDTPKPQ